MTDSAGTEHRIRVEVAAEKNVRVMLPIELGAAPRALAFDPDVELLAEMHSK